MLIRNELVKIKVLKIKEIEKNKICTIQGLRNYNYLHLFCFLNI